MVISFIQITFVITFIKYFSMKRFWDKVQKTDTCWNWIGSKRHGYGVIKIEGKNISTHRLSYEMHIGPIPFGVNVCHSCDNPSCVNPNHLFLGTQSDNMIDAMEKGRIVVPEGIRFVSGHSAVNASLHSNEEINLIRNAIIAKENKTLKQLSTELGVKYQLLRDINCGRVYNTNVL